MATLRKEERGPGMIAFAIKPERLEQMKKELAMDEDGILRKKWTSVMPDMDLKKSEGDAPQQDGGDGTGDGDGMGEDDFNMVGGREDNTTMKTLQAMPGKTLKGTRVEKLRLAFQECEKAASQQVNFTKYCDIIERAKIKTKVARKLFDALDYYNMTGLATFDEVLHLLGVDPSAPIANVNESKIINHARMSKILLARIAAFNRTKMYNDDVNRRIQVWAFQEEDVKKAQISRAVDYNCAGNMAVALNKYFKASRCFRKACELHPENKTYFCNYFFAECKLVERVEAKPKGVLQDAYERTNGPIGTEALDSLKEALTSIDDRSDMDDDDFEQLFQSYLSSMSPQFIRNLTDMFVCETHGTYRLDKHSLLTGLSIMVSGNTTEEKLEFVFKLYDTDKNAMLSREEFTEMMRAFLKSSQQIAMVAMTKRTLLRDIPHWRSEVEGLTFEHVLDYITLNAFDLADTDHNENLSAGEFITWAIQDRVFKKWFETLDKELGHVLHKLTKHGGRRETNAEKEGKPKELPPPAQVRRRSSMAEKRGSLVRRLSQEKLSDKLDKPPVKETVESEVLEPLVQARRASQEVQNLFMIEAEDEKANKAEEEEQPEDDADQNIRNLSDVDTESDDEPGNGISTEGNDLYFANVYVPESEASMARKILELEELERQRIHGQVPLKRHIDKVSAAMNTGALDPAVVASGAVAPGTVVVNPSHKAETSFANLPPPAQLGRQKGSMPQLNRSAVESGGDTHRSSRSHMSASIHHGRQRSIMHNDKGVPGILRRQSVQLIPSQWPKSPSNFGREEMAILSDNVNLRHHIVKMLKELFIPKTREGDLVKHLIVQKESTRLLAHIFWYFFFHTFRRLPNDSGTQQLGDKLGEMVRDLADSHKRDLINQRVTIMYLYVLVICAWAVMKTTFYDFVKTHLNAAMQPSLMIRHSIDLWCDAQVRKGNYNSNEEVLFEQDLYDSLVHDPAAISSKKAKGRQSADGGEDTIVEAHDEGSDGVSNYRTVRYENGNVYVGYMLGRKRNGKGKMEYANGDVYEGLWTLDLWDMGKYSMAGGDWREGTFRGGVQLDGTARFLLKDKYTYDGEIKNNRRHGNGSCVYVDGTSYKGAWKKGRRHGMGVCRFAMGGQFEGIWRNDRMWEGSGWIMSRDGTMYIGDFEEGRYHGEGNLTLANGDFLVGVFKGGALSEGTGMYTSPGGERYNGCFKGVRDSPGKPAQITTGEATTVNHPIRNGVGTCQYPDGSYYSGQWFNGLRHGNGTFISKGYRYEGQWFRDSKSGTGIESEGENGEVRYEGEFRYNLKHGIGQTLRIASAPTQSDLVFESEYGRFEKGVMVEKMEKLRTVVDQSHQHLTDINRVPIDNILGRFRAKKQDKSGVLSNKSEASFCALPPMRMKVFQQPRSKQVTASSNSYMEHLPSRYDEEEILRADAVSLQMSTFSQMQTPRWQETPVATDTTSALSDKPGSAEEVGVSLHAQLVAKPGVDSEAAQEHSEAITEALESDPSLAMMIENVFAGRTANATSRRVVGSLHHLTKWGRAQAPYEYPELYSSLNWDPAGDQSPMSPVGSGPILRSGSVAGVGSRHGASPENTRQRRSRSVIPKTRAGPGSPVKSPKLFSRKKLLY